MLTVEYEWIFSADEAESWKKSSSSYPQPQATNTSSTHCLPTTESLFIDFLVIVGAIACSNGIRDALTIGKDVKVYELGCVVLDKDETLSSYA